MDQLAILKRKILLKKQAVDWINKEARDLQILLALQKIREHFEAKITQPLDPVLSRKLDCINYLIEN